jgi:D-xylose 1-dehydrogenase (NADP+, D-xylono-1,5-lactone-forming)
VIASLRWGLLGTARINRRLIPAMRAARRSELVAVASRDAARAASYADEWRIGVVHASYDALLRDRQIDAVYIPLPNSLHVEWTLRALDAGKHVLCEKPLALKPEDVDRIAAVAHARSLVVAEAFMYRHEPVIARVVEVVGQGALGRLWLITAGFSYQQSRANDVRLEPLLGGGSLWDIGCYAVSLARLIANAEPVSAHGLSVRTPGGVDEAFSGLLQFPANVVAAVHSSFRAEYRSWAEVTGSNGVLRVTNPFRPGAREEIHLQCGEHTVIETIEGSAMPFVRQIDDFIAAAMDGKSPTVSLADSRGNAAALAALSESALSGSVVTI